MDKMGECAAKTVMRKIGFEFDDSYADDGTIKGDRKPDLKYADGRYLEVTHTKHPTLFSDSSEYFSVCLDKKKELQSKYSESLKRFFSNAYPRSGRGRQQEADDKKVIASFLGLGENASEADLSAIIYSKENIIDVIREKSEKHNGKDIDLFIFVTPEEFEEVEFIVRCNEMVIEEKYYDLLWFVIKNSVFYRVFICELDFKHPEIEPNQMFCFCPKKMKTKEYDLRE